MTAPTVPEMKDGLDPFGTGLSEPRVSREYAENVARSLVPTEKGDGVVVVPREPTEAMLRAGNHANKTGRLDGTIVAQIWSAMIAATQQAVSPPEDQGSFSQAKIPTEGHEATVLADAESVLRQRFPGVFDPNDPLDLAEFPGLKNLATEHIAGLLLEIAKASRNAADGGSSNEVNQGDDQ